ncbi:MAG: pyridoxamine 5'-phosphate oxidase family protein [Chloroflexi bacterium]|nr:MAG: pyridoxamine 5'-phosphate oxidase family protein [Chloroflexota bacterium]TMF58980.1 MAG: pyridoxamine 5'-phosphate oxidase family protein [Chloroflexota bacterium]
MRETAKELATLQALIDRSLKSTGPHMKGIIHPGKYSLNAKQVVKLIDGMKTIAVAAPAPNGDPLVAPMDGWFLHGKFFFSSSGDSIRVKGLRTRPRASIAYFEGERFLINAHGPVELMFKGHPDVSEIDAIFDRHYGSSAFDWSDEGVYVRLDADRFFTYSRTPNEFPS